MAEIDQIHIILGDQRSVMDKRGILMEQTTTSVSVTDVDRRHIVYILYTLYTIRSRMPADTVFCI